ncbi:hypothetical protein [Acidicapsa ligni]|uniref:hypothetical protein n=1 Tax=Acidicapsa ligni TaxID=542300 RepID=UPI0021E023BC|nr:hypothetical protein [Acidicapsa ligni]
MKQLLCALLFAVLSPAFAHAQDPLTAFPNNYKLILDTPDLRVIRCHYGPHEHVGVHNHSDYPTIYVYLSDSGPVRFTHDETPPFVMTRPPVKTGAFRIAPGRPERHSVDNLGDLSSDYLRIELKKLPLHSLTSPKRDEAPATLTQGNTEEFSDPDLTIHRIICSAGAPCPTGSPNLPTLLVAFSPAKISTASTEKQMRSSDIQWLPNSQSLSIAASTPAPAHVLEIQFQEPKK